MHANPLRCSSPSNASCACASASDASSSSARARDVGGARRRHAMVCLVRIGGWVYGYMQRGFVYVPLMGAGAWDEDANE